MDSLILDKLEGIEKRLDRIETYFFIGNGKPSLKARIEFLEAAGEEKKSNLGWMLTALIAIGAAILPLLFGRGGA